MMIIQSLLHDKKCYLSFFTVIPSLKRVLVPLKELKLNALFMISTHGAKSEKPEALKMIKEAAKAYRNLKHLTLVGLFHGR